MPDREEMGCIHCGSNAVKMPIDSTDPLSLIAHCTACGSDFTAWDVYKIIRESHWKHKHKRKNRDRELSDMFMPVISTLRTTIDKEWPW